MTPENITKSGSCTTQVVPASTVPQTVSDGLEGVGEGRGSTVGVGAGSVGVGAGPGGDGEGGSVGSGVSSLGSTVEHLCFCDDHA